MFGEGKTKLIAVSPYEIIFVVTIRARNSEELPVLAGIAVTLTVGGVAVEIPVVVWILVETSNGLELLGATVAVTAGGVTIDVRVEV
jgi:hypothetical protein